MNRPRSSSPIPNLSARWTVVLFVVVALAWQGLAHLIGRALGIEDWIRSQIVGADDAIFIVLMGVILYAFIGVQARNIARNAGELLSAETARRDAEQRLRLAMHAGGIGAWEWVPETHEFTGSSAYLQMWNLGAQAGFAAFLDRIHPEDRSRVQSAIARAGETARGFDLEFRLLRADGSVRWIASRGEAIPRVNGDPTRIAGVVRDVTERHQAEDELRESEQRFRQLADNLDLVFWIASFDLTQMLYVSPAFERVWGRSRASLYADPASWIALVHPEDAERVSLLLDPRRRTSGFDETYRLVRPDGSVRWVRDRAFVIRDAAGIPYRLVGTAEDVTERVVALERLAEREELQRQIFAQLGDSCALIDVETGHFLEFNDAAYENMGYTREEFARLGVNDIEASHDPDSVRAIFEKIFVGEVRVLQTRHRRKDGELRDVRVSARGFTLRGRRYFAALWSDITEQLQAQAHLRKLSLAVEQSPASITITNTDGVIEYVNPRFTELTGYTLEEAVGKTPRITKSGVMAPETYRDMWRTIKKGERWRGELVNRKKSGALFREDVVITPLEDEQGHTTHFVGVKIDVTARREAEYQLEEQLDRAALLNRITRAIGAQSDLQSILAEVMTQLESNVRADLITICLAEDEGRHLRVSNLSRNSWARAERLGLREGEIVEMAEPEIAHLLRGALIHEPDLSKSEAGCARLLYGVGVASAVFAPLALNGTVFGLVVIGRGVSHSFTSPECEFLRQLGDHLALAIHKVQLYGGLQAANSELRQTHAAILQQERLRALGQMASGVAHDINNAISPVSIYCDLLQQSEPALSDESREFLRTIQNSIQDVAGIVSRLREFYRKREAQTELTPVALNHVAKEVAKLTRARWVDMPQERGIVIDFQLDLGRELPEVSGVESEIREATINLVFNAVDAMPQGGTLTIRTGLTEEEPPRAYIEVADTGTGMDEETRQHCLEPFFTTKGERGTGLGLAMVCGVAERHEAEISIQSSLGEGTAIRIIFRVPEVALAKRELLPAAPHHSSLRILVVDDDPLIRRALDFGLQVDRHVVLVADGGQKGLELFRAEAKAGRPFDFVITDLGMPHVDGRQVAAEVKAESPQTPVVLLTGWGQRLIDTGETPENVDRVLSKPPRLGEIRQAIADLAPRDSLPAEKPTGEG